MELLTNLLLKFFLESSLQLEDLIQSKSFELENSVALERRKRDLNIGSIVTGLLSGTTGLLDTISNGLSSIGSFFNVSWFFNFFVVPLNVISTILKTIKALLSLLPLIILVGEIILNVYYIISYFFSGNLVVVGIYLTNLVLAFSTYPF